MSDMLRIQVSFSRLLAPEWFDVLSQIKNSRQRAEILRNHLKKPSAQLLKAMGQTTEEATDKPAKRKKKSDASRTEIPGAEVAAEKVSEPVVSQEVRTATAPVPQAQESASERNIEGTDEGGSALADRVARMGFGQTQG